MVMARKKFQIGMDYAPIVLTNSIKGGDQEERNVRGFRSWNEWG